MVADRDGSPVTTRAYVPAGRLPPPVAPVKYRCSTLSSVALLLRPNLPVGPPIVNVLPDSVTGRSSRARSGKMRPASLVSMRMPPVVVWVTFQFRLAVSCEMPLGAEMTTACCPPTMDVPNDHPFRLVVDTLGTDEPVTVWRGRSPALRMLRLSA